MPAPAPAPDTVDDSNDVGVDIINLAAARLGLAPSAATTERKPAAAKPSAATDDTEVPEREEGEPDDDYSARLEEAGIDPAEHIQPAESAEDRAARLAQGDLESDEDYEARLDAEGLTRDDVAPAAEPTEEEKKAAAQKARDEADLKKLPEGVRKTVRSIIEKRLGKMTAQAKAKEAEFTARVGELEAQLSDAKAAADGKPARATVIGTIHPLLLDPSEEAIAKHIASVEALEDWATEHEDGFEPTEAQLAQGYKPLTKIEVRQRLRAYQRERDKLVGEARSALAKRAASEAEAKQILPAFFDAKSPDFQAARSLLREQPELKRFPDYMLRAAEIVLGRKALAALRTAAAKPKTKLPPPRASRAPGGGTAAKGGTFERKLGGADATSAARSFAKAPTRENLAAVAGSFLEDAE